MLETDCAEHDRLTTRAHEQLKNLKELIEQQMEAFESGDKERFIQVDKHVENALGEKERRIGALRQHDEEHGCQGPA